MEVKENRFLVGSVSIVHFGARFPLLFETKAKDTVEPDLWHMRLHRYISDPSVWLPASVLGKRRFQDHEIELHTEDILDDNVLQAALSFMPVAIQQVAEFD